MRHCVWGVTPLSAALIFWVWGCGGAPARPTDAEYPGTLRSPSELPTDFLARQQVEVVRGDTHIVFDAVLQKRGNELVMLVLTPFGTRALVITQRGTTVTVERDAPMDLPFSPRVVLLDVQRVLFPLAAAPSTDGDRTIESDGERTRESWRGGRLVSRYVTRVDGRPGGELVVRYDAPGLATDGLPPARVVLDDGWAGVRLVITTLTSQRIGP
jgi:hypothetical protein